MVAFLIICNLLLSGLNVYCVWKLWRWRSGIARFSRRLERWERWCHRCLPLVPLALAERRLEALRWRDRYQRFQQRWRQGQQVLLLASLFIRARRR